MKIFISGGHLTPALAFIDYLQLAHPQDTVIFCGRLFSQDKVKQKSQEQAEVTKRGIVFIPYLAPRWDQSSVLIKILYPFLLLRAVGKAGVLMLKHRPDGLLSFGGYLAVPLAIAAFLWRVPVVTHEQTRTIGLANRLISKLAQKVAISFPELAASLPAHKVVLTGNPLRPGLFIEQPQPAWFPHHSEKPLVYITGGNQGSEVINSTVQHGLERLLRDWTVIHQCGNPTTQRNYLVELERSKDTLPVSLQPRYHVREWLSDQELGWVYSHAQTVISRAGANTVLELAAHQLPSILIPLPYAHGDEQTLNARYLADIGGAILVAQKELTASSLQTALMKVHKYKKSMADKLRQLEVQTDAPASLYSVINSVF